MSARMIGLRLYLCMSGCLTAADMLSTPQIGGGMVGSLLAALLLLTICLLGIFDALVNDVLSSRWELKSTMRWRHDGFIMLAVVNLACLYALIGREGSAATVDMLRYILDAATAVYVAVRDIQLRFIQPRSEGSKC